ncbi:MAG TPA: glycosyltransferase family 2 protein [Gammaproteobacteria bacterium]|nr:glycosyltransferase family 2 protein [Gammaproteobacteria bacterium]
MSPDAAQRALAPPISILVLTKNEEQDLPACLDSVAWSDDVHVFDSCSTDRTAEIAAARGARVTRRPFDGFASQRNAALHGLPFEHGWVLTLDADERVPLPLARALAAFVDDPPDDVAACRIRRRDFLGRTWLERSQISPYYVRLVRPHRVRYRREVNEVLDVDGAIHDLAEPFDHYPFSKGMRHWLDKHNVYSSMEASCALDSRRGETPFSLRKAFLASDFNERRFHQKELFYRMPLRPFAKFLYVYFWRRGFLDGSAGFTYATLQAIYEYMIVLKARELEQRGAAPAG